MSTRLQIFLMSVAVVTLASCATGGVETPPSNLPSSTGSQGRLELPELPATPAPSETAAVGTVQASLPANAIDQGKPLENYNFSRGSINEPDSPLARRIIFFGYDSSDIAPEYLELVSQHAAYLATYSDVRVRLEGHTDERGSREYNIALGDNRSRSVARIMQLQGVNQGQFSSLSYGEEVPLDEGSNASAYRRNRRVEIVYEGIN